MKRKVIIMTAILTLSLGRFTHAFSEVSSDKWYHKEVMELKSRGIINGYEDEAFRPNKNIVKAETLAMILRSVDISEDQGISDWADSVVSAGDRVGIINSSRFEKSSKATRTEVAEMMVKALGLENRSGFRNVCEDSSSRYDNILYNEDILKDHR